MGDITLVWYAVSLPVFEPLNVKRLEKLCEITMACLYCSVCTATATSILGIVSNSKGSAGVVSSNSSSATVTKPNSADEDGLDTFAVSLVEKSIEIFNLVSDTIKNSTRAGGNVSFIFYCNESLGIHKRTSICF